MSMKSAIISLLKANAALTALVDARIRFGRSPAGDTLPRIVIHMIDADHAEHLLAATGKAIGRIQVNCYAESPKQADQVATAVREAIQGFRGLSDDTFISAVTLADERDTYDPPLPGQDTEGGIDGMQQDYKICWTTSIPTFS